LIERLQRAGWSAMETQLGAELGPSGKEIEIVLLECRRIHRD
jgi:hypothetical protein